MLAPITRQPLTDLCPQRPPLISRRPDLLPVLVTLFLALQFLIPARLVIPGLGAAGRPSAALCLGLALMWGATWIVIDGHYPGPQPIRWLVGTFLLVSTLAYAAGYLRGLPMLEARAADRRLLGVIAAFGLALAVADGVRSRRVLDTILRRMVLCAGIMSFIGIFEALTGSAFVELASFPGLQANQELIGLDVRGADGSLRVASTASHYIEFGVVLAMTFPVALHYAIHSIGWAQSARRWGLVVLITGALPLSISRSAILGLAVGLTILAVAWTWRRRAVAVAAVALACSVFQAAKPDLLVTIQQLFIGVGGDPSIQNRLSDYAPIQYYLTERPWLGRGLGTFVWTKYLLLDNQYLLSLVETGALGVLAFLLVLFGGYFLGRSLRLRGSDESTQHLGQALAAAIAVAVICSGTFDSLAFPTFSGVLFLLVGATGALWRLDHDAAGLRLLRRGNPGGIIGTPLSLRCQDLVGTVRRGRK